MRETKPQKRLVSKGKYVRVMGKNVGLQLLSLLVMIVSFFSGPAIWVFLACTCLAIIDLLPRTDFLLPCLLGTLISGGVACALKVVKRRLSAEIEAIEQIAPITPQNVHLLPAQELLRGSDLPPTVQQSELLRATQAAQKTAKEELLRAMTGDE